MEQLYHSEDFIRLRNEGVGYSLVDGRLLVIGGIPYLNKNQELNTGTLVMKLATSGNRILAPRDHTAHWIGEHPANTDGTLIAGLVNGVSREHLGNNLIADFFLSCKQVDTAGKYIPYKDYYDKVMMHLKVISTPAKHLYPEESAKLIKPIIVQADDSPFVYGDTNASRAGISGICNRLEDQKIAIIGLGGTGSYLLDSLAKCPVKEIHIFDDDYFDTHNAFRCPGAASIDSLNKRPTKVQYLYDIYSRMHKGIIPHKVRVTDENISDLADMDFVFISVDSVATRTTIVNHLIDMGKPFIDSGLGIEISQDRIIGQIRVTTGMHGYYEHLKDAFGSCEIDDNLYRSNIQVAELNALAAMLSIIKWKRIVEFYGDTTCAGDLNIAYSVADNAIIHSTHLTNGA